MTKKSRNFAEKADKCLRKIVEKHESMLSNELLHSIYEALSMRDRKEEGAKTERGADNKRANLINEFRDFEEKALREMLNEHRGLLDAELLCKIYEALALREKEKL